MRLLKLSSPSKTIPRFLTALLCFRASNDEYETFLCLVSDQFVETMPRRKDIRDNLEEATVAVHQWEEFKYSALWNSTNHQNCKKKTFILTRKHEPDHHHCTVRKLCTEELNDLTPVLLHVYATDYACYPIFFKYNHIQKLGEDLHVCMNWGSEVSRQKY